MALFQLTPSKKEELFFVFHARPDLQIEILPEVWNSAEAITRDLEVRIRLIEEGRQ